MTSQPTAHRQRSEARQGNAAPLRLAVQLALALTLAALLSACATAPASAPAVTRLTTQHYAPTQTVDVLSAPPQQPFQRIAQLQMDDSTGTATRSQLIAQLTATARSLGANALIVAPAQSTGTSSIGFNPSGGQMQDSGTQTQLSVSALAIRYTGQ